ncbi:hypothetical protein AB4254_10320 [Vibrio breoganii]
MLFNALHKQRYVCYILLYLSFAVAIMPIRLMGIFNTAYIVLPISMIVSILISYTFFIQNRGQGLSLVEYIIMLYPMCTIPLAVVNGHEINYIITDALKPILWIGVLGYFKTVKFNNQFFEDIKTPTVILAVCSVFTVSSVGYIIATRGGVRASASDISMLFPLFYFLISRYYAAFFFMLAFILLGGKVGPLISIVIVFLSWIFVNLNLKRVIYLFLVGIIFIFIAMTFNYDTWREHLPILGKFRIFFDGSWVGFDSDFLDKYLLGGRLSEVTGSLTEYRDSLLLLFTGPGVGYTYDLVRDGILEQSNRHGVHLSPISLVTIYGLFYTLIFYGYLFYVFINSLFILKKIECVSKVKLLSATFFIANLVNSFTVYAIFSVLLFPMVIGLLLNNNIVREDDELSRCV